MRVIATCFKWLLLPVVAFTSGCTSSLERDDVLAYKVSHPLNLQQYYQSNWYRPDKHEIEEIRVIQPDGYLSRGVRLSVKDSDNTVFYLGGAPYRDQQDDADILGQLAFLGLNVVTFRQRGIDEHGYWPTLAQLKTDTDTLYQSIKQRYEHEYLILHGAAMSTFWVAEIAAQQNREAGVQQALVVEAPVTTVNELAMDGDKWAWLREKQVAEDLASLDNYQTLAEFDGPLLVLIAGEDTQVPAELSARFFAAQRSWKKSVAVIENTDEHALLHSDDALAAYTQFVRKHGWENTPDTVN